MKIHRFDIGTYSVEIDCAPPPYNPKSTGNANVYNALYFVESEYRHPSVYQISTFLSDNLLKRILIGAMGGATTVHENSFITEKDRLVICCSDTIFCLQTPDLSLLWKTKADDVTCFQIFKYQSDYIIHGEVEISRLSHNGDILWHQGGADIFTEEFKITDNYIYATDFGYRKYMFDFDGNNIS
ncbi:hypothetical protein SAMN05216464_10447 [Mucilaginibacter pineti]|uniref:PQQ-like domain-containing protein n=1 Tax=Mucilaginibacter pineti TaxID=1391627 RepID=A0A1G7ADU6_9SPHI|nr:hypothetical protein [Mucilaginibacter pineti]SDE12637.1 hypothetical protein SAMN05216464_10447 [Mucilaginibacter pineti]